MDFVYIYIYIWVDRDFTFILSLMLTITEKLLVCLSAEGAKTSPGPGNLRFEDGVVYDIYWQIYIYIYNHYPIIGRIEANIF